MSKPARFAGVSVLTSEVMHKYGIVSGLIVGVTAIVLVSGCHSFAGYAHDERGWLQTYESVASDLEQYGGHPSLGHYYRNVEVVLLAGTPYLVFSEIKSYADGTTVIDYSVPLSAISKENIQLREIPGLSDRIIITVDRFAPIVIETVTRGSTDIILGAKLVASE